MKIDLKPKITVKGYSQLFNVHWSRIKLRSRTINNNVHCSASDAIRKANESYTSEYRIVKEPDGYIAREVLHDTGINGHHKTLKKAIVGALYFVDLFVDEPFEHESNEAFQKMKKKHQEREKLKKQPREE